MAFAGRKNTSNLPLLCDFQVFPERLLVITRLIRWGGVFGVTSAALGATFSAVPFSPRLGLICSVLPHSCLTLLAFLVSFFGEKRLLSRLAAGVLETRGAQNQRTDQGSGGRSGERVPTPRDISALQILRFATVFGGQFMPYIMFSWGTSCPCFGVHLWCMYDVGVGIDR